MVDAIFALTMSPFRLSTNLDVVSGTFHDNEISCPLSEVFVAVIVGALGAAVSMLIVSEVPTFEVFAKASIAYNVYTYCPSDNPV